MSHVDPYPDDRLPLFPFGSSTVLLAHQSVCEGLRQYVQEGDRLAALTALALLFERRDVPGILNFRLNEPPPQTVRVPLWAMEAIYVAMRAFIRKDVSTLGEAFGHRRWSAPEMTRARVREPALARVYRLHKHEGHTLTAAFDIVAGELSARGVPANRDTVKGWWYDKPWRRKGKAARRPNKPKPRQTKRLPGVGK